jgi:aminoglycoside/choline kinase family phosphotransferase
MEINEIKSLFKSLNAAGGVDVGSVISLKGDASGRKYSRVIAGDSSYILMEMDEAVGPVTDGGVKLIQKETFPAVGRFLEASGIPVPRIIAEIKTHNALVIEDVGDVSLGRLIRDNRAPDVLRVLGQLGPDPIRAAYRKAIDVLEAIQGIPRQDHFVFQRSLGVTALKTEVFRFVEMYAQPRGASVSQIEKISEELQLLVNKVAAHPLALSHRDFMPMNIHFRSDGSVVLIDFQDFCLASRAYDVGALLTDRDFDFDIGESVITATLAYARDKLNLPELSKMYKEAVLQRTLRLIGQFSRLAETRSPMYGGFVPGCIKRAQSILAELGEYPHIKSYLG